MNPYEYGVLLPKSLPEEVLQFLTGYIHELRAGDHYLFSSIFEVHHPYVKLQILRNDGTTDHQWKVRLPIHYILAVADLSDRQVRQKMGFVV